jgi:hypothetical protein
MANGVEIASRRREAKWPDRVETQKQKDVRERRDQVIIANLPIVEEWDKCNELLSFDWYGGPLKAAFALYYRQARMAGVSCVISSSWYAVNRSNSFISYHTLANILTRNPSFDHELLYRGQQLLDKLRRNNSDVKLAVKPGRAKS